MDCLMGIVKDKTKLYVTHQVEFLPAADLILVMQNGKIAQAGRFDELLHQNIGFEVGVGAHNQALESILSAEYSSRAFQPNKTDAENITSFLRSKCIGFGATWKTGKVCFFNDNDCGDYQHHGAGCMASFCSVCTCHCNVHIVSRVVFLIGSQYYIPTARELARLSGIQRVPILHHFAESLTGAATIRAFG